MKEIKYIKYLLITVLFLGAIFVSNTGIFADERVLKTNYCEIYYSDDKTLSDFFWRISGKRFTTIDEIYLAKSQVDVISNRVRSILDMYPANFHVKIQLYPKYETGEIAKYSYDTNTVTVYADRITDGILAHEIAHAVICNYFDNPPPQKMQEILTQYVDKYLWNDY